MSRPIRFQDAGLAYHVMSRGNNKMRIFLDDLDYARFVEILAAVVERFELDAWLFCVMPNHYHLVFRTRRPNLSRAIRHLNGRYAQWWNKRHSRVGHVYQARFKGQIVEQCDYLLRLCRYVLLNPVRAQFVPRPWDWKWSSYDALAGRRSVPWIDTPSLLHAIDPDDGATVHARLLEYVDGYADPEIAAFLRKDRRVIGSDVFAAQFTRRARAASREVPARERMIGTPSLARLLAEALQRGDGLGGGVGDAYQALYPIHEIAECAGLSAAVVAKLVNARFPRRAGRGTGSRRSVDLTPRGGHVQT